MGSNGVLLLMIIVVAAVAISWNMTIRCNDLFIQKYGRGIISYGWAGVCGFAGLATISSFGGGTNERFIVLIVTIILTVISVKKCRQRAAEIGADEESTKMAVFIQFIAPIGFMGIILALSIGNDQPKKRK